MKFSQCIAEYGRRVFELDVRSLAAFRMAMAALLLADLCVRAGDLRAMYSDDGIAPTDLVRRLSGPGQWSLHWLGGTAPCQATLFLLAAGLAVSLAAGYRTRFATIGSWILLASLHARLPTVLNAGDTMLRVMLFWGMFLPLGAAWSIDARRRATVPPMTVASGATAAFLVQLAAVYWFAGLAKWNDAWLRGDALSQIFAFQFYGKPLGRRLLDMPWLTEGLSRGVVWFELLAPLVLFVPWGRSRLRTALVAIFFAFHLAIAATITVGLFPWVGMAAWLAVVPPEFWNRLGARRPAALRVEDGTASRVAFAIVVALVLYWNFALTASGRQSPALPGWLARLGNATTLRQSWHLFARPATFDAQFVYEGRLKNGKLVDLFTGVPLAEGAGDVVKPGEMPNHRWRKLHKRIVTRRYAPYRQPLAEYVLRRWNHGHAEDEQAVRLDFYCLRRPLGSGSAGGDYVRLTLARLTAGDDGGNFAEALRDLER